MIITTRLAEEDKEVPLEGMVARRLYYEKSWDGTGEVPDEFYMVITGSVNVVIRILGDTIVTIEPAKLEKMRFLPFNGTVTLRNS